MTAFLDRFDINTDLIYGRGEAINLYILHYKGEKYFRTWPKDGIDTKLFSSQFNLCIKAKNEGFFAINTFNEHLSNSNYATSKSDLGDKDTAEYRESIDKSPYKPHLANVQTTKNPLGSKSAILDVLEDHKDKLKKSNKKIESIDYGRLSGKWDGVWVDVGDLKAVVEAAYDLCIRRSCKFGIEYTTRNVLGKVHYALDGLNIASVCDKATITNKSGYEKIPICTSELRYIFRNWNSLNGKVLFYMKYEASDPPWKLEAKDKWKNYAVDRVKKSWKLIAAQESGKKWLTSWGADPSKPDSVELLRDKSRDPDKFISAFHSIPAHFVNKEAAELV